jgi:hypothetical protein
MKRWKAIEEAEEEVRKEKEWLMEEREKFRLAELKFAKDKEEIEKLAKIW